MQVIRAQIRNITARMQKLTHIAGVVLTVAWTGHGCQHRPAVRWIFDSESTCWTKTKYSSCFDSSLLCCPPRFCSHANAPQQFFVIDQISWSLIDLHTLLANTSPIIRLHFKPSISAVLHIGTTASVSPLCVCMCVCVQSITVSCSLSGPL